MPWHTPSFRAQPPATLFGLSLAAMTVGGIVAGLAVAIGSGLVARNTLIREDTSLAVFYLLSLSLGVLIVSVRGNNVDLLHVLFGTVLALDDAALALLWGISGVTLSTLFLLRRALILECLDPSFLRQVSGLSPAAHYGFLMMLVINLVAGFHTLGTLMAVGIMVMPAASARFWVREVGPMVLSAIGIALTASFAGLLVSYHTDWPTSPAIVLCLGMVYLLSLAVAPRGVLRQRHITHRHLRA